MHVCPAYDVTAFQRSVQAEAMARANGLLSIRSAEIGAIPDLSSRLAAFEASLIVVGAAAMFRGPAAAQRAGMMAAPQFLTRVTARRTVRVGASKPPTCGKPPAVFLTDAAIFMPGFCPAHALCRGSDNTIPSGGIFRPVTFRFRAPGARAAFESVLPPAMPNVRAKAMNATIASALCADDIQTINGDGECRILDLRLAEALGYERPADIRPLIERHVAALERLGGVFRTVRKTSGTQGGRPSRAYMLTKRQAVYIAAKSETDRAVEITIQVVEIFDAVTRDRNGSEPTIPVVAHRRRQALARVDDISRLSALIDRLEEQDDHHKGMAMPIRDGMAMVRIDRKILLIDLSVSVGFTGTALIIDRDDGNVRLGEVCETGSPLTQMLGGPRTAMTVSPKRSGRWPCQVIGRLVDIRRAPTDRPSRARDPDDGIKALRAELEQGFRRMLDDMTAGAARQKGSS